MRRAIVLVIVHYVESLGGIRAVHAFRREPRNQEIFEDVNGRYRDANIWSNRLASTFGPGDQPAWPPHHDVGSAVRRPPVVQGQLTLGVLTAFVLYLRQFFEPMQDLSQFYNVFQAAGAALEKLAGVIEETPDRARAGAPVALGASRAPSASSTSRSRIATRRCCTTSTSGSRPARSSPWWVRRVRASPRWPG